MDLPFTAIIIRCTPAPPHIDHLEVFLEPTADYLRMESEVLMVKIIYNLLLQMEASVDITTLDID